MTALLEQLEMTFLEGQKEIEAEQQKLEATKARVFTGIEERHKMLQEAINSLNSVTEFDEIKTKTTDDEWEKRQAEIHRQQEEIDAALDALLAD